MITDRLSRLGVLLLLAGAGCAGEPPEWCDPALREVEWNVAGLPPPGTPPEWIVTRDIPFGPLSGDGLGYLIHTWMPWDLNWRQAYYLRGDESVHIRMRVSTFDPEPRTMTFNLRAFVDTRLATMRYRGEEVQEVYLELDGGIGEALIEIPAEWFQDGLSIVTFAVSFDQGEPRPYFAPYGDLDVMSFTVVKNTPDAVAGTFPDTEGYEPGEVLPGYPHSIEYFHEDLGAAFNFGGIGPLWYRPNPGGPTRITLRVQSFARALTSCPDDRTLEDTFAIVAVLDGQQVTIGGHEAIVATLGPDEARVFEFDLDLPEDGEPHRYDMYRLGSLGRPTRLRGGGIPSPWRSSTMWVAGVVYGDERYCYNDPELPERPETWCFGM